jgi:Fic family protein
MISGGADGPRFVPPPVLEMRRAMDDLERYIGARAARPPLLIQLALIHDQFETIHPFMDGNGRMGRLLIPLILHERGALPLPLLYLSAYFERWKDEYRDHQLRVSQTGQWKPWLDFFLRGVVEQAYEAVAISEELVTLRERYRQATTGPRVPSNVQTVIDMLFEGPAITASDIRIRLGVSSRTAYDLLGRLEALDIIREATGKQYGKVYLAPGIVRATMLAGRPRQEEAAPPRPIETP